MKTLYLMRHAKSVQDLNNIADIDRPLMHEGVDNTHTMADYLKSEKIKIRHIVSSPAKRAIATAEIMAREFGIGKDGILTYDELYKPDIPAFEDSIFSLPDDWDHVLLISHNPGITQFAMSLVHPGETMPTAGILSLSFEMERWINLYASPPVFNFFIQPKSIHKT
jgi:phosphohistidine phosphatase